MIDLIRRHLPLSALAVALVGATALTSAAAPESGSRDLSLAGRAASPAEQVFADAPDGVDPMTTGPVSEQFAARTDALRCDAAVWPNIPLACYPDR